MLDYIKEISPIITAIALAYNVWQTWAVKKNVQTIETSTNSMKDALVAATEKAALAEGTAVGLEQGRKEAGSDALPLKVEIVKGQPLQE